MPILIEQYGVYFRKQNANVWTVFAAGSSWIKASEVLSRVTLSVGYLNPSAYQDKLCSTANKLVNSFYHVC
jgi:hypothetical protein